MAMVSEAYPVIIGYFLVIARSSRIERNNYANRVNKWAGGVHLRVFVRRALALHEGRMWFIFKHIPQTPTQDVIHF
ncbi:hypothetical protein [Legionella taurinensis]|nr:hypothetical protein [Legionella taurinensis]